MHTPTQRELLLQHRDLAHEATVWGTLLTCCDDPEFFKDVAVAGDPSWERAVQSVRTWMEGRLAASTAQKLALRAQIHGDPREMPCDDTAS
jgi:hypothetical protein